MGSFLRYNPDAHLVEEIQWKSNERESKEIRRSNDGGQYHDGDEGMAAVAAHHVGRENTDVTQEPADQGQLEDQAHDESQGSERRDITAQRDGIDHIRSHLVGTQEPERDGEQDKIIDRHTHGEQHIHDDAHADGNLLFALVERRTDEAEQLRDDIGRSQQQCHVESGGQVGDELTGQFGIDQLHMIGFKHKGTAAAMQQCLDSPVGDEVALLGRQQQTEDLLLEPEQHQRQERQDAHKTPQHLAQHLQMPGH